MLLTVAVSSASEEIERISGIAIIGAADVATLFKSHVSDHGMAHKILPFTQHNFYGMSCRVEILALYKTEIVEAINTVLVIIMQRRWNRIIRQNKYLKRRKSTIVLNWSQG